MKRLTRTLIVLLIVYHTANFFGASYFRPKSQWVKVKIEAGIQGNSLGLKTVWVSSWPKAIVYFDLSSQFVKDLGYVARYGLRQIPEFILTGRYEDQIQFFERDEINTLGVEKILVLPELVSSIRRQVRLWEERGADVIFIPIPSKMSLYRGAMPASLPSCSVWEFCEVPKEEDPIKVYRSITSEVPASVDLLTHFQMLIESGKAPYLVDDSHWNSRGIVETSRLILSKLRPGKSWNSTADGILEGHHFTDEYLQLPKWFRMRANTFGGVEELFRIEPMATEKGRIILMGTSYCQRLGHTDFGLGPQIKRALGRELLDFCMEGGGLWESVKKFEASGIKIARGDIIIWETPVAQILKKNNSTQRELPTRPSTDMLKYD